MTAGRRLPHDWYPADLPAGVVIGERSWLYSSFAFLHCRSARPEPVRIGQDSGVYHTSFFDLGPGGEVVIGDFCAVVGAVFATNHRVEVGDHALIAHDVTVADHAYAAPRRASDEEPDEEPGGESRDIVIGPNVWVGARAVVLGGTRIGEDAVVGAGAVVAGIVPAGAVVAGNPAQVVRQRGAARPPGGARPTTVAGFPATML